MPEVDPRAGQRRKTASARIVRPRTTSERCARQRHHGRVRETATHLIEGFDGRARAFIQVQNGCDHRCTFCIIPYGRGPSRSVPVGEVVRQVRKLLVERGYREVVLSGVDITDYGRDLPGRPTLGQLARRLLAQVPDLPRSPPVLARPGRGRRRGPNGA